MMKKSSLVTPYVLVLISLMFLLASCASSINKEDSKNNKQPKRVFGGYHPRGHGHGHH
ncbi:MULTISPECIES: hypothetical protein [Legionellaceae]|uniref:Lipoprotein n=2 Tax=Legionellaceae TaxID=444 RepID=A0ABS1WEL0_9GAMM|nr:MULTISPECIES: hypothetical protein [Legionellaceae]KTD12245.1 hypothetical protein Lhac_1116 [Legionella hackeliae]MBL7478592.1 hypothetical protein [Legionella bononiensis]MBL7527792.1 hypothetical protein [Legionella bononiensis]MBL7563766.1 hypothetical protein [Legionella bononiensis]MCW8390930.1 hypothetical protein [Legionella pneumophila]